MSRALYEQGVKRRILELREDLMRHDDNARALTLMEDCVPWFLEHDHELAEIRERTRRQVGHVRDPDAYADYYAANVHERPFEEQYGLSVEEAHRLPRVAFLRGALAHLSNMQDGRPLEVLDLAGNDGFLAANLASLPCGVTCDLVDLHPGNVELAQERAKRYPSIGSVERAAIEDLAARRGMTSNFGASQLAGRYDAVIAFEVIEHVSDPGLLLDTMRRFTLPGGHLFVSTPDGVDHGGDLAGWDVDEPKGHVRVYNEASFQAVLERAGQLVNFLRGPDGVMVAQVRPGG